MENLGVTEKIMCPVSGYKTECVIGGYCKDCSNFKSKECTGCGANFEKCDGYCENCKLLFKTDTGCNINLKQKEL